MSDQKMEEKKERSMTCLENSLELNTQHAAKKTKKQQHNQKTKKKKPKNHTKKKTKPKKRSKKPHQKKKQQKQLRTTNQKGLRPVRKIFG